MSMNTFKSKLIFFLNIIPLWIIATLLFIFLRNFGAIDNSGTNALENFGLEKLLLICIVVGIVDALIYGSVEILFDNPNFQKYSYFAILAGKILLFFIGVKLIMLVIIFSLELTNVSLFETMKISEILRSKTYWVIFIYYINVSVSFSFLRMIKNKLGPELLWNTFIGKYRKPREEHRIFMFLDLKSSTSIAEKIGHIKYSRLLQSCFADISPVVTKYNAEIYQYVGDEVVVSWPFERGIKNNNCIYFYFDFLDALQFRSEYYNCEFDLVPFFKAGLHSGKVTTAEIGLVKREIAYHGDVLNTTSRIQSRCNELHESLLVSDNLLRALPPDDRIFNLKIGDELLKGKRIPISIHGIKLNEPSQSYSKQSA